MTRPSLDAVKAQAKALRQALTASGRALSHAEALELIAQQHGARDWNTLHARLTRRNAPPELALGDRVTGSYLGQAFRGKIVGLSGPETLREIEIALDEAIDVVRFDSFSNWRRRIRSTVDQEGRSHRKTSDGAHQMVVEKAPS